MIAAAEEAHTGQNNGLVMHVPTESMEHFATLDETVKLALELAESEDTLAAPTDEAMRDFRQWVCGEVRPQAQGNRPNSWQQSDLG